MSQWKKNLSCNSRRENSNRITKFCHSQWNCLLVPYNFSLIPWNVFTICPVHVCHGWANRHNISLPQNTLNRKWFWYHRNMFFCWHFRITWNFLSVHEQIQTRCSSGAFTQEVRFIWDCVYLAVLAGTTVTVFGIVPTVCIWDCTKLKALRNWHLFTTMISLDG